MAHFTYDETLLTGLALDLLVEVLSADADKRVAVFKRTHGKVHWDMAEHTRAQVAQAKALRAKVERARLALVATATGGLDHA